MSLVVGCNNTPNQGPSGKPTFGTLPTLNPVAWQLPGPVIDDGNASQIRPLGTLNGHKATVNRLAYSHSGKFLVSVDGRNSAILWDLSTGKQIGPEQTNIQYSFFDAA